MNLPFFLELDGFRAVHATWHPEMIDRIDGRDLQCPDFFLGAFNQHTEEGEALETLLKGVGVELPDGIRFTDHTGATSGPLVAYRWKGETCINPKHYIRRHDLHAELMKDVLDLLVVIRLMTPEVTPPFPRKPTPIALLPMNFGDLSMEGARHFGPDFSTFGHGILQE